MRHLSLILTIIVACAVCGCTDNKTALQGDQKDFTPEVLTQNELMQQFAANHPGLAVLKYARADLDNDAKEDLIVIYRVAAEKNQMCVMRHRGPEVIETNSVPAPVSDQMIQFRNIDEKPPLEFILQGRKGAKVGYAIFRIEKGLLTDLFGEGMEDCC
jgi:hypothetical protein